MNAPEPTPVTRIVPSRGPLPVDVPLLRTFVDLRDVPSGQFTYTDGSFRFGVMQRAVVHYRAHGGSDDAAMGDIVTALLWLRHIERRSPADLRSLLSHPCHGDLSEALRRRSPAAWQTLFFSAAA